MLGAVASGQGLAEKLIGKTWIFRQQGAVQISTIDGALRETFQFVFTVIAVADNGFAQSAHAFAQEGFAAVIFKADKSGGIVSFDEYIADHAAIACHRVGVNQRNTF